MTGLFRSLPLKDRRGAVAFPIVLLLWFSAAGCANSCFVAVLNPGGTVIGGTASNLPLACPPPIKKASVKVVARVTALCEACPSANRIQGLFLFLGGIELHAKAGTSGDSSEWLELFPDLEKSPRQLDLMSGDADATASELLGGSVAIPAGIYDQVRLRLLPNQGDAEVLSLSGNTCGESGFNCLIMADGHVYALRTADKDQELRIPSEALPGGLLFFSPNGNAELLIQLTPIWSMVSSFPEGLRLLPVLQGSARVERIATQVVLPL